MSKLHDLIIEQLNREVEVANLYDTSKRIILPSDRLIAEPLAEFTNLINNLTTKL